MSIKSRFFGFLTTTASVWFHIFFIYWSFGLPGWWVATKSGVVPINYDQLKFIPYWVRVACNNFILRDIFTSQRFLIQLSTQFFFKKMIGLQSIMGVALLWGYVSISEFTKIIGKSVNFNKFLNTSRIFKYLNDFLMERSLLLRLSTVKFDFTYASLWKILQLRHDVKLVRTTTPTFFYRCLTVFYYTIITVCIAFFLILYCFGFIFYVLKSVFIALSRYVISVLTLFGVSKYILLVLSAKWCSYWLLVWIFVFSKLLFYALIVILV